MIRRVKIATITLVGADGSAAGNAQTPAPVVGRVLAIHINHSSGGAATSDVTIATVESPTTTILTITDSATDAWYYPRAQVHGVTGTALTMDGTRLLVESLAVSDYIKATVAQGDSAETVDVTILYEE